MLRHNITKDRILGHSDISIGRKIDPGIFFPWNKLIENNLSIDLNYLFYNFTDIESIIKRDDFLTILKNYGYDIKNKEMLTKAFLLRFNNK